MRSLIKFAKDIRNSLNTQCNHNYVDEKPEGSSIPQIIHQTYFLSPRDENFPVELSKNIEKLKALNPGWQYRFYNDEDINAYIKKNFPELLSFYLRINSSYGAAKADFFRYLVMYKDGGVYLDIKSNVAKPLDDIINKNDKFLLSHWPRSYPDGWRGQHPGITNPIGELQQWYIIGIAGHPFLKHVINNVCNNINHYNPIIHDYGSWGVFNLTGPIAYTEAIYPNLSHYPHRIEKDHTVLGLIYYSLDTSDMGTSGHHKIFSKKHYSQNEASIINISLHHKLIFYLVRPIIKSLKKLS